MSEDSSTWTSTTATRRRHRGGRRGRARRRRSSRRPARRLRTRGTATSTRRRQRDRCPHRRARRRPRPAHRPWRADVAGHPGPRPGRRPAAARRPRHPSAHRRRRLPREAQGGARALRPARGRIGQGVGVARSLDPMPSADRKVDPRHAGDDRRRRDPVRGRGPLPPRSSSPPADVGGRRPGDQALLDALSLSQRLGMLGARPIAEVVDHSEAFVAALRDGRRDAPWSISAAVEASPAWSMAWRRPDLDVVLVERRVTRADHLRAIESGVWVSATGSGWLRPRHAARPAGTAKSPPSSPVVSARRWVLDARRPLLAQRGVVVVSEPPGGTTAGRSCSPSSACRRSVRDASGRGAGPDRRRSGRTFHVNTWRALPPTFHVKPTDPRCRAAVDVSRRDCRGGDRTRSSRQRASAPGTRTDE